jgi:hypothetical protein
MPLWAGLGFWLMFAGLFAFQAMVVNSEPWLQVFVHPEQPPRCAGLNFYGSAQG